MSELTVTPFPIVYNVFLSKITDDMYMELTEEETKGMLLELLKNAIPKFEFPRVGLKYEEQEIPSEEGEETKTQWVFLDVLNNEEINVLATYMIVEWLSQQLASIENVRMKYSGADFKFTSQANHMQKILQMKKDYEREGFHLQRLYKRRLRDTDGIYKSTFSSIMQAPTPWEEGEQRWT